MNTTTTLLLLLLLLLTTLQTTETKQKKEEKKYHLYQHHRGRKEKVEEVGFVFNHIPKCGGTSFMDDLCEVTAGYSDAFGWYPPACFADVVKKVPFSWNMPGCPGTPRYGSTHCSYTEIKDCIAHPTTLSSHPPLQRPHQLFLTILRHPTSRVISEFLWWRGLCGGKRRGGKRKHPTWSEGLCDVVLEEKSLGKEPLDIFTSWLRYPNNPAMNRVAKSLGYFPELLQSPQRPREECLFFDLQKQGEFVRKLSVEGEEGERGRGERGGRGARGEVDYEERLNENGEVLEMILKGIEERFFFIGLTERYEESVKLFSRMIKKTFKKGRKKTKSSTATPATNPLEISSWGYFGPTTFNFTEKERKFGRHRTKKQDDLSPESLPLEIKLDIEQKNALDLSIFEFVLERFERALEEFGVKEKEEGGRREGGRKGGERLSVMSFSSDRSREIGNTEKKGQVLLL